MSALAETRPDTKLVQPAATRLIARFICEAKVDAASRHHAARAFIDTLGAMLAGGNEPGPVKIRSVLEPTTDGSGIPSFWTHETYRRDDAALLFGTAGHALDYDDVAMLTVVHPSAPVLAAILSAATDDTSGAQVIDALVVGTESMIRLGQATGFRHYAMGFHATATMGAVGAAAACARLFDLDETRAAHAVAIAASHSSGLRKNFGTMVKSLHVGMAALNGLRSARLAQAGFEGAVEAIEGEGFLNAFSGAETDTWPEGLELGTPFAITDPGFEQKRYPCCYQLHKMIEATLKLKREHGVTLDDVAAMRVDMAPGAAKPLIHPCPRSGLNALFSGPYAVAAALEDGRVNLKSFTDEAVLRPALQGRLRDVEVVETAAQGIGSKHIGDAPVTVTLTLKSGDKLSETVVVSPGSLDDPLTDADLSAKWADCLQRANPAIADAETEALLGQGLEIGSATSVAPFLASLRKAMRGARMP